MVCRGVAAPVRTGTPATPGQMKNEERKAEAAKANAEAEHRALCGLVGHVLASSVPLATTPWMQATGRLLRLLVQILLQLCCKCHSDTRWEYSD